MSYARGSEPSMRLSYPTHRESDLPHGNPSHRPPRTITEGWTGQNTSASYLFVADDATRREPTEGNSIWLHPGDIIAINRDGGSLLCLHSTADDPPPGSPSYRRFEISRDSQQSVRVIATLIPRQCYSVDAPDTNDQLTIITRQRRLRERLGSHSHSGSALVIRCLPPGQLPGGGPWSHVFGVPGEDYLWVREVGGGDDWDLGSVITSLHQFPPEIPVLAGVGQDE